MRIGSNSIAAAYLGSTAISRIYLGAVQVFDGTTQPLNLYIDADIDTVGERDDIAAMALILADQDTFNIVGLSASAPDSKILAYQNVIDAYAIDRPVLLNAVQYPDRYKTAAELSTMRVQGATTDAPSVGYWASGDAGYAAPHAAAQSLIAAALAYGDPDSTNPRDKLWVFIQGGYTTLAQAAYEAIQLGGQPDFFRRIRVVGQPNFNSYIAPNAWNYLFGNIWPAAGTPGLFGDAWMLCGYLQWHAFNRDNGTTDTVFWNEITEESAMGAHLRSLLTRPGGTFLTPHFRAGDAGAWFWLKSAHVLNDFDPESLDNLCGTYRTYEGVNPWPSRTVGYGNAVQTGTPNPQGVTFSTTVWAPELTVTSEEAALTAVDLDAFYDQSRALMYRYQTGYTISASVPTASEGDTITFTMTSRTPGETVDVVLTGITADDIVGGDLSPAVTFDGSGNATLDVTLASDAISETTETLTATIGGGLVSASVLVSDAGGSVQSPFLETFTGTNGTNIQTRATDSGNTWTKTGGNFTIASNAAWGTASGTFYTSDYVSAAQSYDIEADFVFRGGTAGVVYVRFGVVNNSNYLSFGVNGSNWRVNKKIAGTSTILLQPATGTLTVGAIYTLKVEVRGANIELFVNGTSVGSVSDAPIMAAQAIGLEGVSIQTSTTGMHIDRLSVLDVA